MAEPNARGRIGVSSWGPERRHRRIGWQRLAPLPLLALALCATTTNGSASVYLWVSQCAPDPTHVNLPPDDSCIGGVGTSPSQPTFSISASQVRLNIEQGSSSSTTLTVVPVNGFQGAVTMAVAPSSDSPVTNEIPVPTFGSGTPEDQSSYPYSPQTLTFSVSLNTPPGQYHYTVQAESLQANPPYVTGDLWLQVRTAPGAGDNSSCPASGCHFTNHGTVLAQPRVFLIFWGSLWSQDTNGVVPTLQNLMQEASGTKWWGHLSEWGVGSMSLGGLFVDTQNDQDLVSPITDAAVDTEVLSVMSRLGWSFGGNDIYYVIPEVGYPVSGTVGADPSSAACAYHNYHYSPNYAYVALPDFSTPGYSSCVTAGVPSAESKYASHELVEAATDPQPGKGVFDPQNDEIADVCNDAYTETIVVGQQAEAANSFYSQANHYCEAETAGGAFVAQANACVTSYGDAPAPSDYVCGGALNAPVVGVAATPSGSGYWLTGADGGVFNINAPFYGSEGNTRLNAPVVGIAGTPDGHGYWLVGADGGVFTFGDATFYGSMGGKQLNQPVSGIAPTPDGQGYWLVAQDGGIFAFGDALFHGNGLDAPEPCNYPPAFFGVISSPSGGGYQIFANDGQLRNEGDAQYLDQDYCSTINSGGVGIASHLDSTGADGIDNQGGIIPYGDGSIDYVGPAYNSPVVGLATVQ